MARISEEKKNARIMHELLDIYMDMDRIIDALSAIGLEPQDDNTDDSVGGAMFGVMTSASDAIATMLGIDADDADAMERFENAMRTISEGSKPIGECAKMLAELMTEKEE